MVSELERHGDIRTYAGQVDGLLERKSALISKLRDKIATFRAGQ